MIYADPQGHVFACEIRNPPGLTACRLRVYGLDGAAVGPVIDTGYRSFAEAMVSPERFRLFVSTFDHGHIKCFDWRTGEELWKTEKPLPQVCELRCFGPDRLLARQLSGGVSVIDQATGEPVSRVTGVAGSSWSDSRGEWIVLARSKGRGGSVYEVEFYKDLETNPVFAFETSSATFSADIRGDDAVIALSNGVIKRFDLHRGAEIWKYYPGDEADFRNIVRPGGAGIIFGFMRERDEGGLGIPTIMDADTTQVLKQLPKIEGAAGVGIYVDAGRAAVTPEGLTRIPELTRVGFAARADVE